MKRATTNLDQQFSELQTAGLHPVHVAMAKNIIENRIRGPLPFEAQHLEGIIGKIRMETPELVDRVKKIFKNAGA